VTDLYQTLEAKALFQPFHGTPEALIALAPYPGRLTSAYCPSRTHKPAPSMKPRPCAAAGRSGNSTGKSVASIYDANSTVAQQVCDAGEQRDLRARRPANT